MSKRSLTTTGELARINLGELFYKRCLCFIKRFTVATYPHVLAHDSGHRALMPQRKKSESCKEGVAQAAAGKWGSRL